jgi:5'-deoxynucleotidase YfbR-like HD superfamily hydrolase
MSGFWIQTYTGKRFDLDRPKADSVDIRDIAHALSLINRFTGPTQRFYSVAQHSLMVAYSLPPSLRLAGLLHDAAEAYTGDMSSPLKSLLRQKTEAIKNLERMIEYAIAQHFNLHMSELHDPRIKQADLRALATERRDLMACNADPSWYASTAAVDEPTPFSTRCWPFPVEVVEKKFLAAYEDFSGKWDVR